MIWIRSQDKTELLYCKRIYSEYDDGGDSQNKIYANEITLGTYKSYSRALQVLDEIQKQIRCIKLAEIGALNANEVRYVFEMPAE